MVGQVGCTVYRAMQDASRVRLGAIMYVRPWDSVEGCIWGLGICGSKPYALNPKLSLKLGT